MTVRPDGFISLILLGDVAAEGETTRQLDDELSREYAALLPAHPDVIVTVDQMVGQVVYVGGEVKTATVEPIKGSLTLLQSIMAAGGFLPSANEAQVSYCARKEAGFARISATRI